MYWRVIQITMLVFLLLLILPRGLEHGCFSFLEHTFLTTLLQQLNCQSYNRLSRSFHQTSILSEALSINSKISSHSRTDDSDITIDSSLTFDEWRDLVHKNDVEVTQGILVTRLNLNVATPFPPLQKITAYHFQHQRETFSAIVLDDKFVIFSFEKTFTSIYESNPLFFSFLFFNLILFYFFQHKSLQSLSFVLSFLFYL